MAGDAPLVCLGVAVDHRIRRLFKPLDLGGPTESPKHSSVFENRGKSLGRSDEEIQVTAQLAGSPVKGGIAVTLQQPRHNQPFEQGLNAVIKESKTLSALNDIFTAVSCRTLDIRTNVAVINLLPYESERDLTKIDDAKLRESFRVSAQAIYDEKPAVLLCAGKVRLDEDKCKLKGDASTLESIGVGRGFGSDVEPVEVEIRYREHDLVRISRVNSFDPSYAINYRPHDSLLRQLLILSGAETCGRWRKDWKNEGWMDNLRDRCQINIGLDRSSTTLDWLEDYRDALIYLEGCASSLILGQGLLANSPTALYERMLFNDLSEMCNNASLILYQISYLQAGGWSLDQEGDIALKKVANDTFQFAKILLEYSERGRNTKLVDIFRRGAESIRRVMIGSDNRLKDEFDLPGAGGAFLELATNIEMLLADLLLEKEKEDPNALEEIAANIEPLIADLLSGKEKEEEPSASKTPTRQNEAERSSLSEPLAPDHIRPHRFAIQLFRWSNLKRYLISEFDPPWILDDVVVLVSNNDEDTWCTTYKTYIEWRWGLIGSNVLTLVNSLLQNQRSHYSDAEVVQPLGIISVLIPDGDVPLLYGQGSQQEVEKIVDILGWIFDSLSLSNMHSEARYGDESVITQRDTHAIYSVTAKSARVPVLSESCWHPLFSGKAISHGPIPERPPNMKGLEIDYPLLVLVSGVDLPVMEDGGIYLNGFRSALYPFQKDTQYDSLQWHLEIIDLTEDDNGSGMDEDDQPSLKPPLVWYKTRALDELTSPKRHFVGWCTSAVITLGTKMQNPGSLNWSDAKSRKRSVIESTTVLNMNISFHGVGASAGKSYKRGRNERNPYENHEKNLRTELLNATKSQVLLFRHSTKQAWLVPKTSVLLQLVQSYMAQLRAGDPELSRPIPFTEASYDGGQSAYQSLWNHRNDSIPLDVGPCLLSNIMRMFLYALEKLAKLSEPGNVYGWEMNDVIDPPAFLDLKRQDFRWRQFPWLGGWSTLLPKVHLVFFFEGLSDPIVANEPDGCANCREIPKDRNLLGITMISLKHFTRRFRSKYLDGNGQLTESCYWDSPKAPFGRCNGQEHRCSAIQKIIKNRRCRAPSPRDLLNGEMGAIIFEACALAHEEPRLRIL